MDASRWNYDRLLNYLEIFQEHNPRTVNAQFSAVSHLVKHVARHHGFPTLDMERFWEEELRIYTTQIKKLRAHRVNTPPRFESMQRAVGMEPNLRNRALLLLAAKTGARKSEILSLDWEDIDLDEGIVRFKPDQHHKRTSFVGLIDSETIVALRLWRGQCKHTASPAEKAVFVGTTAKSAGERLGRQGAFIVVGDAFERVGSKSYNVHSMRHWFSDTLRARGMPDHMIAYLRGDAPSSTLDLYTHLESEDGMKKLRIAYDAAMPSLCC